MPSPSPLSPRAHAAPFPGRARAEARTGAERLSLLSLVFLVTATLPPSLPAQQVAPTGSIVGRILDADTEEPVSDAEVELLEPELVTVSDPAGIFRFPAVPPGRHTLRFHHLGYGTQRDSVQVGRAEDVTLRITLARTPIDVDPVVVRVMSREERRERAIGSSRRTITREEIAEHEQVSRGIEDILVRRVPGLRVTRLSSLVGANICIEFRGGPKSIQDGVSAECNYPLLVVDQNRFRDPNRIETAISTLQLNDIREIEIIPPAEAGVEWGTNALYGVIRIETRLWGEEEEERSVPAHLQPDGTWNWNLETERHSWKRTFAASFLANAAGMALGLVAADQCIDFQRLDSDFFNSSCGGAASAGARLAALTLPGLASSTAAEIFGRSSLSEGRWRTSFGLASIAVVPGFVIAGTGTGRGDRGSQVLGLTLVGLGVPVITTLADHFFRHVRDEYR